MNSRSRSFLKWQRNQMFFKDILKRFEKEIIKFTQKESNTLTTLDIKDGLLSIANELKKTKGEIKNLMSKKKIEIAFR
jgi:hypothetical protein